MSVRVLKHELEKSRKGCNYAVLITKLYTGKGVQFMVVNEMDLTTNIMHIVNIKYNADSTYETSEKAEIINYVMQSIMDFCVVNRFKLNCKGVSFEKLKDKILSYIGDVTSANSCIDNFSKELKDGWYHSWEHYKDPRYTFLRRHIMNFQPITYSENPACSIGEFLALGKNRKLLREYKFDYYKSPYADKENKTEFNGKTFYLGDLSSAVDYINKDIVKSMSSEDTISELKHIKGNRIVDELLKPEYKDKLKLVDDCSYRTCVVFIDLPRNQVIVRVNLIGVKYFETSDIKEVKSILKEMPKIAIFIRRRNYSFED